MENADGCYVGVIMQRAIANGKPPLEYLVEKGFNVFSQLDVFLPPYDISLWPQVDALKNLVDAYPKAYFIHTHMSNWASVEEYADRLNKFPTAGLLNRLFVIHPPIESNRIAANNSPLLIAISC